MIIPPTTDAFGLIEVQRNTTLRQFLNSIESVDGSSQTYRVYYLDDTLAEVDYTDSNLDEVLKSGSEVEVRSEDGSENKFYYIEPSIIIEP